MPSHEHDDLRQKFRAAGQDQVFAYFDKLTDEQKGELVKQLSQIDPDRINRIYKQTTTPKSQGDRKMEPLPSEAYDSIEDLKPEEALRFGEVGMNAIKKGQVAVVLLAGGQGTRLGSSQPKGCYDVGLVSHKSLFQLQAERIQKLMDLSQSHIHWYVMTSGPTRKDTEKFFVDYNFFGVKKELVHFFEQGVLPALTNDGKIIMESMDKVSVAPDGNGGIYASLRNSGILQDMQQRNVKLIHAYCVDNCLVRVADPQFLGYCIDKKAQCGVKVVRKLFAEESVGIICRIDGHFDAVEYSEISKANSESMTGTRLTFDAANIANHFYTIEALEIFCSQEFEKQLDFHIAKKKIKSIDYATGEVTTPTKPNGIKLELFIFDILAHLPLKSITTMTNPLAVLSVPRYQDFSPLKNASGAGQDCPETSRKDMYVQSEKFLVQAGVKFQATDGAFETFKLKQMKPVDGKMKEVDVEVKQLAIELSPLFTYAGEGLDEYKNKTLKIDAPTYVSSQEDLNKLIF